MLNLAPLVGPLSIIASAALWGGVTSASKYALNTIEAVPLLLIQLSASVAFLWGAALALQRKELCALRPECVLGGWIGIIEPGLAYLLTLYGLRHTTASIASIITALEPIFVLILAIIFFGERISRRVMYCILIALAGCTLTSSVDGQELFSMQLSGAPLVALGILAASVYVLLSKSRSGAASPLISAALQQSWGLAFLAIWASIANVQISLPTVSTALLGGISGILQYALAFWLYLIALARMPVVHCTIFLNLVPVFGLCVAHLALGENITSVQLGGVAAIIAAVHLSTERVAELGCETIELELQPRSRQHVTHQCTHTETHGALSAKPLI